MGKKLQAIFKGGELLFVICLESVSQQFDTSHAFVFSKFDV